MSHNMQEIAAQLRRQGYRVTPQRQLILDAVCRLGGHVTAEEVASEVRAVAPTVNQGTIYRTLNFFCEQGIVAATRRQDGLTVYEMVGASPHHHFVCRTCGASREVPDDLLHELYSEAQDTYDFIVEIDHMTFFGHCRACRDSNRCRDHHD